MPLLQTLKKAFSIFAPAPSLTENDRALQQATLELNWEKAKQLLNNGADPKTDHSFVLRGATFCGRSDVVQLALEKGADLRANNFEAYQSARVWEIKRKDAETLKVILDWARQKKIKLPVYARDRHPEQYV